MAQTVKSLIKTHIKGKGDSGDWLEAMTAGTVAPEEPKLKKARTAPVLDDETRRINAIKEEARRAALGRRATALKESSTLG